MSKIKFSLVIPVAPWRNPEILKSLSTLKYDKNKYEIIVEKGKNASENRNKGIQRSLGETIVFLDDDAIIKEDYLEKLEKFLTQHPNIDVVGGPQLSPKPKNMFERFSGMVLASNFGAFRVNKRYKETKLETNANEIYLTSANLCVKKIIFNRIGGFNKNLWPGEDPEFIVRAKKAGMRIAYNPELIVYHKRRGDFAGYCKQIFKYGFTRPRLNRISGETKFFFLIPMIFSIYFLLLPLLSLINIIFIIPLIAYLLLSVIFSVYDSARNGSVTSFFVLPFLYLFTHLSYGIGMLVGYFAR